MNENTIVLTKYNNAILFMSTDGKRPLEYQFFNEGEDISTVTELVALSDKRARQAQNK